MTPAELIDRIAEKVYGMRDVDRVQSNDGRLAVWLKGGRLVTFTIDQHPQNMEAPDE